MRPQYFFQMDLMNLGYNENRQIPAASARLQRFQGSPPLSGPPAAFFTRNKTITLVFCEGHPVPRRDDRDTSSNISCLSEEAGKPTAAIRFNLNCHQPARPAATGQLLYTLPYLSPDYIIFFNMWRVEEPDRAPIVEQGTDGMGKCPRADWRCPV